MKRILPPTPFKALLLALIVGLVFGLGQIGEPMENAMQVARNKLRSHPASGEIVLVAIDDRSVGETGSARWNGSQLAGLVRQVDAAGARRIHLNSELGNLGTPEQLSELEAALSTSRAEILLPARFAINQVSGARSSYLPPARFARHARVANTNLFVWWDDMVWQHPYAAPVGDRQVPSLSSILAGAHPSSDELFRIDYAIDIRSIPVVSASDVLNHRIRPAQLRGKQVVIARTDFGVEHYRAPGVPLVPGILIHLVAAETLLAGAPVDLGWGLPMLMALLLAAALLYTHRRSIAGAILAFAVGGAIVGPLLLEMGGVHIQMLTPLAVILTAALIRIVTRLQRSYQTRGTTNIITGKPNLQALRRSELNDGIVVSARVANYVQITATLPPQDEKELVEQIVGRLEFGAEGAHNLPGRRGRVRLDRQPGPRGRRRPADRGTAGPVPEPDRGRHAADRPRRHLRPRPRFLAPAGAARLQRAGGGGRGGARRQALGELQPGDASRMRTGRCRCSAGSTTPSTMTSSGSPISPRSTARPGSWCGRGGAGPLDPPGQGAAAARPVHRRRRAAAAGSSG